MSDTSARASRFAFALGSLARNGLIGARAGGAPPGPAGAVGRGDAGALGAPGRGEAIGAGAAPIPAGRGAPGAPGAGAGGIAGRSGASGAAPAGPPNADGRAGAAGCPTGGVAGRTIGRIGCGGIPMAISVQTGMSTPSLHRFGSEELKQKYLVPAI